MENHLDGYFRLHSERITSAFSVSAFYINAALENFPDSWRIAGKFFAISPARRYKTPRLCVP
ncbi:hypothetical protein ABU178_15165 [Pantoea osteomyelitidis]|uniref:Uncharacterized protein n=1 Tax=Pantoea osteomyelitidis TaxID=3230026 RepID=A0ABW7PZS8_9GAMM